MSWGFSFNRVELFNLEIEMIFWLFKIFLCEFGIIDVEKAFLLQEVSCFGFLEMGNIVYH